MRKRPTRSVMISILLGSVLLVAGCGTTSPSLPAQPVPTEAPKLYGADGNMGSALGAAFKDQPGALVGMKGTTPLTPLTAEFASRLHTVDPQLSSLVYTGEAYDAVAIVAIAAEYARTTDPVTLAKYLVGVTTVGAVCETVPACLALARQGKDLQYRGVAMQHSGLTDVGEPSSATYGAVSFGRDNQIDTNRTEYVGAGDEKSQSSTASPAPVKVARATPLKIGGLLPHTGRLASFGPPLTAAVRLAISDVNAAGGVGGAPVTWIDGDDGTSAQVATATFDRLVGQGAQVVIGAGASSVTKAIIPKVVAAGRILISPTSTSDELTTVDDNGLFFRTAPADTLQAKALTDVIMRDGPHRVAVISIDESYGNGLAETVQANLVLAGVQAGNIRRAKYPAKENYDPKQDTTGIFTPIADHESALLIKALLKNGTLRPS